MVDYGKAFKVPFQNVKKLFAGTYILLLFWVIAMLISFTLVFVSMIVTGNLSGQISLPVNIAMNIIMIFVYAIPFAFFIRYGVNCANKKFEVPSWKDLSGLFKDGIKMIIIYMIYMIPLYIINFFLMGPFMFASSMTEEAQIAAAAVLLTKLPLILGILIPLSLLYAYVIPAVLLRFMATRKFKEGFNLRVILKKAFNTTYLVAWLLTFLITIGFSIAFVIAAIILAVTIIGIPILILLVFPMFYYYIVLVTMSIIGQAYGEIKVK